MSHSLTETKLAVISLILIWGSAFGYENDGGNYNQQLSEDRLCSPGVSCSPLNSCPLVRDLMHRSCFSTEKLRDFTCGYRGSETMVCCPSGGEYSPLSVTKSPDYFRPYAEQPYQSQQDPYGAGCRPAGGIVESGGDLWPGRPNVGTAAYTTTPRPTSGSYSTASSASGLNVNCGQSMVRDTKESSLGAHPWVVRVGFLS